MATIWSRGNTYLTDLLQS